VDDQGFNQKIMGAVFAALIVVVFAAYILVAVIRSGSRDPRENSIGTITGDALPLPGMPSLSCSVC
jgi:flagellar biogenesis protein FliO